MRKLILIVMALSISGCATLFSSGPDRIAVNSDPPGATVKLDGVPIGTTPFVAHVPRNSDAVFTVEKEGYETQTIDRSKVLNGWYLVNFLGIGSPFALGFFIDLFTHNQGRYSEDPVYSALKTAAPRAPASTPQDHPSP